MKLTELFESHGDLHQEKQEQIIKLLKVDEDDALDILQFALGEIEWENLSEDVREKLQARYKNDAPGTKYITPKMMQRAMIGRALIKELGL